jgi:membrane protein
MSDAREPAPQPAPRATPLGEARAPWYKRLFHFITSDLTRLEHQTRSRWAKLGLKQLRITLYVARRLIDGKHTERAASLTYLSLLAIIPLLAVIFSLFKAFGGLEDTEARLQNFLLNYIPEGSNEVATWLAHFLKSFNAGALGVIGMGALLVTVMVTLKAVEDALNQTWAVRKPRGWGMRLVVYWSLLTVGPILLGASLTMTAAVQSKGGAFDWMSAHVPLFRVAKTLIPVMATSIAFTGLYVFLPSTRVKMRAAWAGGISAAILFETAKWAYTLYTARSVSSNTLYGSLVAFPFFIVWVNYSWRFVLFGADIVHATQNSSTDPNEETDPRTNQATREEAAVRICALVARAFVRQESPPSIALLTRHLFLPAHLVDVLVGHLVNARLLREVQEKSSTGLVPGKPLHQLTLGDIVFVMRHKIGVAHWATSDNQKDAIDHVLLEVERDTMEKLTNVRWVDLFDHEAETHRRSQETAPPVAQGSR